MQQQMYAQKPLKRMDEVAREREAEEHEEMLSKARRASKRAKMFSRKAQSLLEEISAYV